MVVWWSPILRSSVISLRSRFMPTGIIAICIFDDAVQGYFCVSEIGSVKGSFYFTYYIINDSISVVFNIVFVQIWV